MAKKLLYSYIKQEFEKENYVLLTKKYKNNKQKLDYICPNNHTRYTRFYDWVSGKRCRKCYDINTSIRLSGKKHPAWKGGISKEPYCQDWTKDLKEYVKERDGHKCMNPYCFKKGGIAGRLSVHHIDYNKKSCGPENLITLCNSCNAMANYDRDWHKSWYQIILNKRYGYKYAC